MPRPPTRLVVVTHGERAGPDHGGRDRQRIGIGGIAVEVELVAVERAVLVPVDADPVAGPGRDAGEGQLLAGRVREGTERLVGHRLAGAVELVQRVRQTDRAACEAVDGALHDDVALARIAKGFRFVTVASDARILAAGSQEILKAMRAGPAPAPASGY